MKTTTGLSEAQILELAINQANQPSHLMRPDNIGDAGKVAAEAYRSGQMSDPVTMLYVIRELIAMVKEASND